MRKAIKIILGLFCVYVIAASAYEYINRPVPVDVPDPALGVLTAAALAARLHHLAQQNHSTKGIDR